MAQGAAPASVLAQADNIASGEGWVLDGNGKLTITSDEGMTNWKENGRSPNASKVTTIGAFVFRSCESLESITFLSDNPPVFGMKVFGYDGTSDPQGSDSRCGFVKGGQQGIHVPDGKVQIYKEAWPDWNVYIADNAVPAEKHEHNGVTFTAWDKTNSLPTAAGNYYLTENVTLTDTWNVPSGETILCLNGKTIRLSGEDREVIRIGESGDEKT